LALKKPYHPEEMLQAIRQLTASRPTPGPR
jgi:hypothetical protein